MAAARKPVAVACFDLKGLAGYFRGIALAMQLQGNTRAEWRDYDDGTALNIAYTLLPWKQKPGTVEIVQDHKLIRKGTEERSKQLLDTFLGKLHASGPATAMGYISQMATLRQQALADVQRLFGDVAQINREIAGEAAQGARNLAMVQFGATMTLAGIGCALGVGAIAVPTMGQGLAATGIGLGYNVAGTFIKDQGKLSDAGAVAIVTESTKSTTGIGMDYAKDPAKAVLTRHGDASRTALQQAEAKVNQFNQQIARKRSTRKIAKLQNQRAVHQTAADAAKRNLAVNKHVGTAGRMVSKGVPIIFFAHDAWNAWNDMMDVFDQTR